VTTATTPDTTPGTDAARALWLRGFRPAPDAAARLVCLPHAGGSASYFFGLARALDPRVELLAVQYPGRQDRHAEPCVGDVVELAEQLVDVLAGLDDTPLVLFGHSMGATVGFEVARRLAARGAPPARLVVSARCAPSDHRSAGIHLLDDDGVLAELRRLSGTEAAVLGDEELLRMVLPAIRSDYRAAETYRYAPGPPLPVPILGLCGDADPRVEPEHVAGWRAHTDAGFDLRVLPGGHFYFGQQPGELAGVLAAAALGAADGRTG
jgi:pyochelin biosynthesis protein PchC